MQYYMRKIQKTVEDDSEDSDGKKTYSTIYVDLPETSEEKNDIIKETKLI